MPEAVVTIIGLEELQRDLRASDRAMAAALRAALQRGGQYVRAEAQANLRRNDSYVTGKLSRSIRSEGVRGVGLNQSVAVGIAPGMGSPSRGHSGPKGGAFNPRALRNTADPADYGPVVERGSGPRTIEPRNAKALRFVVGGETVFARRVNHPGTRAKPFLVPALTQNAGEVMAEMRRAFDAVLGRIGRR